MINPNKTMTAGHSTQDKKVVPLSVVVATRNRPESLEQTLVLLASQNYLAERIIVVDSSTDQQSNVVVQRLQADWPTGSLLTRQEAEIAGAAPQRNQGFRSCTSAYVLFLDDDIFFQPGCMEQLWESMFDDEETVGSTPTYVGYGYHPPGVIGGCVMALLNGKKLESYAGRVIGPGFTRLPDASDRLPPVVTIDWMGSGCALYKKNCVPDPPFPERFQGASLFEDLCLSLIVSEKGRLVNARTAVAIHAHEGGDHKKGRFRLARMELVNRHFIMRDVMKQSGVAAHCRFALMMCYMTIGAFANPRKWAELPLQLAGFSAGIVDIVKERLDSKQTAS